MSETIQPKTFGGDGRTPGAEDCEFVSFCPPDIQPRTRIIALCGANDWRDNASPQKDGWFLSDFYLFHHLLEDTGRSYDCRPCLPSLIGLTRQTDDFRSSNQLWLTCVDPRTLVSKYSEYVHGSMNGDRRAVLDDKILERVETSKNIRVIPPKVLLERFLTILNSEMRIAAKENQPVLVLIFGHGDECNYGVAIGGQGSSLDAPRLTRRKFNAAVHSGVDLNLLTTSCYSGGWLVKPMVGSFFSSMSKLNISGMTAVGEMEMSRSWAKSVSCGRAGGSIYASAIFNTLVKNSKPNHRDSSDSVTNPDGEDLTTFPTYINLCNSIYEAYKGHNPFYKQHQISFSAQDDKWDSEWRTRSGFPLLDYKRKWEQLREVLPNTADPSASDADATLGFTGSVAQGHHNVIREKAKAYMESFPGPDNAAPNVVHQEFKQLLQGRKFPEDHLATLNDTLDYRLSVMQLATQYVAYLDLDFGDGLAFDTELWLCQAEDVRLSKYKKLQGHIMNSNLFDRPCSTQGWGYHKPRDYLGIALTESSLSTNEACDGIDRLNKRKCHPSLNFQCLLLIFSCSESRWPALSHTNATC